MTKITQELVETQQVDERKPGEILRSVRINKQLSIENIAERLHLRIKIIEAIECDDYSQMTDFVFVRGYLRAYANLLSISADEVIAIFNEKNVEEPRKEKAIWQDNNFENKSTKWVKWLSWSALLLCLTLTALWWNKKNDIPKQSFVYDKTQDKSLENSKLKLFEIRKLQKIAKNENTKVVNG